MWYRPFSFSPTILETIDPGIRAKAIPTTKQTNIPGAPSENSYYLLFGCFGNGWWAKVNFRSGLPLAALRIASYINYGNVGTTSELVKFTNMLTLKFLVLLSA